MIYLSKADIFDQISVPKIETDVFEQATYFIGKGDFETALKFIGQVLTNANTKTNTNINTNTSSEGRFC